MFPLLSVSVREQTTVHRHCQGVADNLLSSIVRPAIEKALWQGLCDAVLAAGSPTSDCAINTVKMNVTFSLSPVIFCHIYRPHPHGITATFVHITTVLPLTLSPFPRYYPNFRPPLPRFYRGYRGFTAVPIPMQLSTYKYGTLQASLVWHATNLEARSLIGGTRFMQIWTLKFLKLGVVEVTWPNFLKIWGPILSPKGMKVYISNFVCMWIVAIQRKINCP